jgi:tetratricopeptide (TPR) repeat protein
MKPGGSDRRVAWLLVLGLLVGTLLLFSRTWSHGFVNYDDNDYVTANPHVTTGLTAESVRWAFSTGEVSYWHPLTWISHQLDWSLFGANAHGHHGVATLWHALNAVLAFLALRRLTGALWLSAIAAALFAWHPLRVESVAWVAERKDVLSGAFGLATLWAYAGYAQRRAGGKSAIGWYMGALVLFAGGLMSKPMLVTLPLVLLALDFWPLGRFTRATWPRLALEKLPFLALSAAVSVVTVVAQRQVGTLSEVLPLGARLANAVIAVARYLGKFFAPLNLAVLYPHPGWWPPATVVAACTLVAAISVVAWRQRVRRPWILAGWSWFLLALLPASGVVQVGIQAMADRYTYLPLLGVTIALLWTLRDALTSATMRRYAWAAAGLVLMAAAARSWHQQGYWKDSFTLFDHTVRVTQDNYLAFNNRGYALYEAGRTDEAIADYRRSLAINPNYADAGNNLGHALAEQGQPAAAIPLYRTALAAKPNQRDIMVNLANALSDVGQLDEAARLYEDVLAHEPGHVNALNGLGVVLAQRGRVDEAVARFEAALRRDPQNASAHGNLGNVAAMAGRRDDAVRHYQQALALKPDSSTWYNLATVQRELGRTEDAVTSYTRSVTLNAANADAQAMLGFLLAQQGRREEAARHLRIALQARPDHAQAKAWLDAVLAMPATK